MATTYTSPLTSPAISTTGTRERTVSDKIRNLFPGNPFMVLIESGLPKMEGASQKRGLIKKRKVTSTKPEMFTYTPLAVEFVVSAWTSITNFTLSSAVGLTPKMLLLNTVNKTVCRIGSVNTTTGVVIATSIGTTAFTAAVTDKILVLGSAYEENSSSPYLMMKDEDNLYNLTQIFRFPAAISNTAGGNPHYGGSYWGRAKERVIVEGLRKVSHNMIFGERATSGETTADAILNDSVRTMRGLWNWAGATYDAGGNMTFEKYLKNMPLAMNDTVGMDTKLVQLCGMQVWADMLQWVNDKLAIVEPGDYKYFGAQSKKFLTARGAIDVIVLDVFDRGDLYKNAIVFSPDDVEYLYKNKGPGDKQDRDLHPKLGIQNNDVDGVEDEILGELSLGVTDGGSKITTVTNWL
jgi:hypothetical protein